MEVMGKDPSLSTSVKDSKPVNANSKEEGTESTSLSPSSNFGEQLSSLTVHNAFLPESDKKAGSGLLLCEKPNVAASCLCDDSMSASCSRAWSKNNNLLQLEEISKTTPLSLGHANDPFDTKC
jgi:hypothetical protein